ncbi:hypothetical protein [Streptomyces sp. NPDC047108]|uniref:hypothetical protein n=1 Tax=Streptomyces sp. NPDC047108 TaxID=3155025 RepID=UPI0033DA63F3
MPDVPDHFDRLLARHAPPPGAEPRTAAQVRPRLPGPFERVEALRAEPARPDEPAPLVPAAPRPAGRAGEVIRHEREIRTDHRTVVRTGTAPRDKAGESTPAQAPAAPLLRPAAQVGPVARPAATDAPRQGLRTAGATTPDAPSRPAAPAPAVQGPGAARAAAAAAVRPRPDAAANARGAARTAAARRGARPVEQVVHVQIGRLEVSAAGAAAGGRTAAAGGNRAGRPAPALSLEDFLARGEKRG